MSDSDSVRSSDGILRAGMLEQLHSIGWWGCVECGLFMVFLLMMIDQGKQSFSGPIVPIVLIITIVVFCMYSGLIAAGQTRNQLLLLPWLVVGIILLVIINSAYIYLLTFGRLIGYILLLMVIVNASCIYRWLTVYSYYQNLKQHMNINRDNEDGINGMM